MVGESLNRLARRIVREETHSAIVEPAIADLQFESPRRGWTRTRAYIGVWRALAAAAASEISADCWIALRTGHPAAAIGASLLMLLGTTLPQIALITWRSASQFSWHHTATLAPLWFPDVMYGSVPAAIIPAAARLARTLGPGARRAAVIVAIAMGISLGIAISTIQQPAAHLRRDFAFASGLASRDPALRNKPVWELRETFRQRLDAMEARERWQREPWSREAKALAAPDGPFHVHGALALSIAACALLGMAWTKRRLRTIRALAVTVFVLQILLGLGMSLLYISTIYGHVFVRWAQAILLFLVACLFALRSTEARA
jgi:hypothetical protein